MSQTLLIIIMVACALSACVATLVAVSIWRYVHAQVGELREEFHATRNATSRVELFQKHDRDNSLKTRDLGPVHERINRVAEELAAVRAQSSAETRMLSEQLRVLQRLIQEKL